MKLIAVCVWLLVSFGAVVVGCEEDESSCAQDAVDACYLEVGCDGTETCTLNTDGMNHLCACLGDQGCDQDWYHSFCDGAPYEEGECSSCFDQPDASP